jgi:hypothetical protein
MKTAKDLGERHAEQSNKLLNQDKAVMGMFTKVQEMTENFTNTAQQMMQQVGAMHSQSEQLAALPGVMHQRPQTDQPTTWCDWRHGR